MPRQKDSSRVSSFLGFGRHPSHLDTTSGLDIFSHVRDADQTWHNPSPDQVAETLKVVMMTRNNLDPVPVQYNSCILQLLEEYQDLQGTLKEKDKFLDKLILHHDKEVQDLKQVIHQLEETMDSYKIEIKNLEILVATGQCGLDVVTLARSQSIIDRGEYQTENDKRARPSGNPQSVMDTQTGAPIFLADVVPDKDATISRNFTPPPPPLAKGDRHNTIIDPRQISSTQSEMVKLSLEGEDNTTPGISQVLQDSSHTPASEHSWGDSSSNVSSDSSIEDAARQACYGLNSITTFDGILGARYQGLILDDKPLPELPSLPEEIKDEQGQDEQTQDSRDDQALIGHRHEKGATIRSSAHNRGFSFLPGDDTYELQLLNRQLKARQSSAETHEKQDEKLEECPSREDDSTTHEREATPFTAKTGQPAQIPDQSDSKADTHEKAKLARQTSHSSVITAFRHNSGRSIVTPPVLKSAHKVDERPKLHAGEGSSEAIIAAARALSGKERGGSPADSAQGAPVESSRRERPLTVKDKAAHFDMLKR